VLLQNCSAVAHGKGGLANILLNCAGGRKPQPGTAVRHWEGAVLAYTIGGLVPVAQPCIWVAACSDGQLLVSSLVLRRLHVWGPLFQQMVDITQTTRIVQFWRWAVRPPGMDGRQMRFVFFFCLEL
jgi:hypothetical protein